MVYCSRSRGPHHPWEYSRGFGLRRTVTTLGTRAPYRGQPRWIDALEHPYPHGANATPRPPFSRSPHPLHLNPPPNGRNHVASRNPAEGQQPSRRWMWSIQTENPPCAALWREAHIQICTLEYTATSPNFRRRPPSANFFHDETQSGTACRIRHLRTSMHCGRLCKGHFRGLCVFALPWL